MSETSEVRQMLVDSAQRLFADHVDGKLLTAAKQTGWSAVLWNELEAAELPRVGVPEEADGAGGSLSDSAAVLRIAARHAAPMPLAETMLAGWLLASAGLRVPSGPLTVAPVLSNDAISVVKEGSTWRINGMLKRVPFARMAKQIVLLKDGNIFTIDPAQTRITQIGRAHV